jgi:peptide deformylase
MKYDPYQKYSTTTDIVSDIIVDTWKCELVEPKHSALHTKATLDPFAGNIDWQEREKEMIQLMYDKLGIGLAAPQVGSSYNMFVMNHSVLGDIGVYKPKILEYSDEKVGMEEGCLSFPLLYLVISRSERIKVEYFKNDGETKVQTWMDGRDARCFLHEFDHLQGNLYIDLASELKLRRAYNKREKLFRKITKPIRLTKNLEKQKNS